MAASDVVEGIITASIVNASHRMTPGVFALFESKLPKVAGTGSNSCTPEQGQLLTFLHQYSGVAFCDEDLPGVVVESGNSSGGTILGRDREGEGGLARVLSIDRSSSASRARGGTAA